MAYHLVGLDLAGTKIATALTQTDSDIVKYETVPVDPEAGADAIVEEMLDSIRRVTEGLRPTSVLGVGVAIAGQVEMETGRVLLSPNLHWRDMPLGERLAAALKWPVYVGNDVGLAALGELHYGVSRGKSNVVVVQVGTGIGAGLILDGKLYQGAAGLAGEFGHMVVRYNDRASPSEDPGTLEHLASGPAMVRRAREAIAAGRSSVLVPDDTLTVEALMAAYEECDTLARDVVHEAGDILGAGVASLVNLLNPEQVVLGGGVIRSVPVLVDRIRDAARARALPDATASCEIVHAQFGREAGVIGATVFAKLAGRVS